MSGLLSFFLTLTLSELASAYPVAGAMASWAWKCARGGVGGERKWGWLLGGVVLAGHAAAVCPTFSLWIPLIVGCIGYMGNL
jgi:amino acid transporter